MRSIGYWEWQAADVKLNESSYPVKILSAEQLSHQISGMNDEKRWVPPKDAWFTKADFKFVDPIAKEVDPRPFNAICAMHRQSKHPIQWDGDIAMTENRKKK